MPTAAKLFGAIAFLLVGFFAAEVMRPAFPEGQNLGYFSVICALLGIIVGWRIMGPNAGRGAGKAVGTGLRSSVTLAFLAIFVFSIQEMLVRSTERRYRGVMDALEGLFALMIEFAQVAISSVPAVAVLIVGGILGGIFANWAAVRWR